MKKKLQLLARLSEREREREKFETTEKVTQNKKCREEYANES